MSEFFPIQNFRVGDKVDIAEIEDMQGVTIERISDSGVTIDSSSHRHTVISGKSPACYARDKKIVNEETGQNVPVKTERTRGKYNAILASIKLPDGEKFTIKEIAELNDLPIPYASKWVEENCEWVGKAEKEPGQRGKTAKLYSLKCQQAI